MDTVTYPDPAVQNALRESFVGLKIDLLARHPDIKEASGSQRIGFAPAFVFTEKGREVRRYIGWLDAKGFRAELLMVRAQAAFSRGDVAASRALLEDLLRDFDGTPVVPEALYLHGMAAFLAGNKDFPALRASWERCAREFATSRFGMHCSVIADAPR
jgi:hypothetical protein